MRTGLEEVAELVDVVERAAVDLTEQLLRGLGMVAPPTVHLLSRLTAPQYLGSVAVRRFHPGLDAARAVTGLGWLASVVLATHVVVVWEHADLSVALQTPDELFPSGLVVLEASMKDHTVRWRPFRAHPGPAGEGGVATVVPEWGAPVRHRGVVLPAPVADLLAWWRQWDGGDIAQARAELERAGYRVTWTAGG